MLDALFHKYIRNLTTPIRLYKPSDFIDISRSKGVRIACGQAFYEVDQVAIHKISNTQDQGLNLEYFRQNPQK